MNKVYCCSDIHGQYELWRQIIESLDPSDTLYFLGDAADRGPQGWDIIKELLKDPRVIYIRGNHEQFLIDCWKRDWGMSATWYWNGGQPTHMAVVEDQWRDEYAEMLSRTPFIKEYHNKQGQTIVLSHAGFTPMDDRDINNEDLLWDREHVIDEWQADENIIVVHGHSYCASKSVFLGCNVKLNETHTVGKYCNGHKICVDGRSVITNQIALLDLDTFEEKIFFNN